MQAETTNNHSQTQAPNRIIQSARWIMGGMGLLIIIIEALEHTFLSQERFDPFFWFDLGIYTVIFPVIGLFLLHQLDRSERKRLKIDELLEQQVTHMRQLSDAANAQELGQYLVELPRDFFPVEETVFYLSHDGNQHTRIATWVHQGSLPAAPPEAKLCLACRVQASAGFHAIPAEPDGWPESPGWFSLPLTLGEQRLGLLFMRLPQDYQPQPEVTRLLDKAALEMAFATDRARLRELLEIRTQQDSAARRELARDMHDVLGQNIAYLRMKLESLSESKGGATQRDLTRLTQIAGESYTQVRQMLFELNDQPGSRFEYQLASLLQSSAERCPLEFRVEQHGKPRVINEAVKRQVLYICREALNNIERYVGAGPVDVILDWEGNRLNLTIRDQGPGFDPAEIPAGHYGLQNMRERAEAVGATVKITSSAGQGTCVEVGAEWT